MIAEQGDEQVIVASRSPRPSHITLPQQAKPYPCMLDFLCQRFPGITRAIWQERLHNGKVTDAGGVVVSEATPYRVNARLSYFREVMAEPRIPFAEQVIYEDEQILLADKPHFLPVTPGGTAVNECLLHRLMRRTGNSDLVPVHRLDRETAGLVLFSKQPATRDHYVSLFRDGKISKSYQAVGLLPEQDVCRDWLVQSRIEPSNEWILRHNVPGTINARSRISLLSSNEQYGRFSLSPLTGKTHQLRLHMGLIGSQILHDRFYPKLLPKLQQPDYTRPLQLLAKRLQFTDPVTGLNHAIESEQQLSCW